MQPQYLVVWTDQFISDVTAICGDIAIFRAAFEGFGWYLCRLPRGIGTWDLSPIGDLRLARLEGTMLTDGTEVPTIYFTFQLHLGAQPHLDLLRAFPWDDDALYQTT